MAKKMLIDATHPEETRVVVVDGNRVEEFDFESENKRQLAGNIYLAKVTRVEPSLQAAFVDYGGNRHGFLAFSEIHPDYYQIPVADREKLLAEEAEFAAQQAEDEEKSKSKRRSRSRAKPKAEEAASEDAIATKEAEGSIGGMDVIDLEGEGAAAEAAADDEGLSPMETVAETPVEEPGEELGEAPGDETNGDEALEEAGALSAADLEHAEEHEEDEKLDASQKDEHIEDIADEDVVEEVRAPRKRRPRKYKIQEVIKVRQILLVQVVKEERGNKGAALTTYLSLAGRYCVLMPNTARGGGISRKITNAADRKKLKAIASEIEVPQGAGLIVRTAGAKRTKTEIKRDYEYLLRLWEQIRELTLKSIAPAKIYEEGNLIKRSIRDLYNREIDEVLVEGERGYRTAKDFMKMIMPSHAKKVKQYSEGMPLFARYQVEGYLAGMFNPTVQLRSGGYIVIGVTEALVAIDVNSGRATKEGSIEETALKTNLEAAEEVARQLRLRDLAGLIVIDFIDMEERRNNAAVEKRMKDKLKTDRARIQVGRISGFGLMEMSRQRLRPGMIEATTQPCSHCHGTGLVRSDDNLALSILRQLEEEGTRKRSREVLLKAPVGIVNFLINSKREHVAQIEARYGMAVRIEADPFMISPDFSIEKFKTATRSVAEPDTTVISGSSALMSEIDEAVDEAELSEAETVEALEPVDGGESSDGDEAPKPKKRRRRRRRRRSSSTGEGAQANAPAQEGQEEQDEPAPEQTAPEAEPGQAEPAQAEASEAEATPEAEEKPKKPRRRSRSKAKATAEESSAQAPVESPGESTAETVGESAPEPEAGEAEKPKAKKVTRSRRKPAAKAAGAPKAEAEAATEQAEAEQAEEEKPAAKAKTTRKRATAKKASAKKAAEPDESAKLPEAEAGEAAESEEAKPKKAPRKRAATSKKSTARKATDEPAEEAAPAAEEAAPEPTPAPAVSAPAQVDEPAPETPEESAPEQPQTRPKKKGWWSLGR